MISGGFIKQKRQIALQLHEMSRSGQGEQPEKPFGAIPQGLGSQHQNIKKGHKLS
jgi:hypothetical protein